jgi:hypothetical protein
VVLERQIFVADSHAEPAEQIDDERIARGHIVDSQSAHEDVLDPLPFKGGKQLHEPGEVHDARV